MAGKNSYPKVELESGSSSGEMEVRGIDTSSESGSFHSADGADAALILSNAHDIRQLYNEKCCAVRSGIAKDMAGKKKDAGYEILEKPKKRDMSDEDYDVKIHYFRM